MGGLNYRMAFSFKWISFPNNGLALLMCIMCLCLLHGLVCVTE